MATTFKVWIEIEEYDDETDEGFDHGLPFASTAQFTTLEAAEDFATRMHETFPDTVTIH